jgi:hypothetical protein
MSVWRRPGLRSVRLRCSMGLAAVGHHRVLAGLPQVIYSGFPTGLACSGEKLSASLGGRRHFLAIQHSGFCRTSLPKTRRGSVTRLLRMYGPPRDCKGKVGREGKSAQMTDLLGRLDLSMLVRFRLGLRFPGDPFQIEHEEGIQRGNEKKCNETGKQEPPDLCVA